MRPLLAPLASLLLLVTAQPVRAAGGTLVDQAVSLQYSSAHWGPAPNANLYGTDAPGVNPLFRSGWWYRVIGADTREYPFPPPDSESYGSDGRLIATWANVDGKGFAARETTWVFDDEGPSGGFVSEVFVNWGQNPSADIALFHLLDADVAGSFAGDSASLRGPGYIKVTDGASILRYHGAGAQMHYLVAPYDNIYGGDVKRRLNDTAVDDFTDSGLPFGPGDFTAGIQFRAYAPYGYARVSVGSNQVHDYERGQDSFLANGPGLLFRAPQSGPAYSYEWLMRRGTRLQEYSSFAYTSELLAFNDFNGDGSGEALTRNLTTGALTIGYDLVSGAGTLAANWRLGASHDFDGDGKADLLWFNTSSRKLVIWLMNGALKVGTRIPNPDQAADANWDLAGAADADGDGDADLLWYNQTTGKLVIWTLDSNQVRVTGNFTDPPSVGSNVWRAVAYGDYGRGDSSAPRGAPDVIWQNDVSKKLVIWYMDLAGRRVTGGFTSPDACAQCGAGAVFGPR